jgi:hypothetical protein
MRSFARNAILISEVIAGIATAELVEEYRTRERVLALQYQANGRSLGASAGKRKRRVEAAK